MKDFVSSSIDRIQIYDDPYYYGLCDNFLPNNLFEELLLISGDTDTWSVPKYGGSSSISLKSSSVLNEYINCWESSTTMELVFNKFCLEFTDWHPKYHVKSFDDLRIVYSLRKLAPGFNYKPHPDSRSKGISIVVFIYPRNQKELKHNLGTVLYKSENKKEMKYSYFGSVDWEVNRAFIISTISQRSKIKRNWHSYHVPEYITQGRVTLMINIIPKNSNNP